MIIIDNKECITDEQKVEALANTFRLINSVENCKKLFLERRKSFITKNKNIKIIIIYIIIRIYKDDIFLDHTNIYWQNYYIM